MTPAVAIRPTAAIRLSFAAASSATTPPSLWPTTAMRFGIDVLAIGQQLDRGAQIVGVVGERRGFGAAAALADAALVVAHDDEAGVGERAGELAEDRDAGRELVAIGRAAAADEDHGRQPRACGARPVFESVPASEKPLPGIFTCSSFGREIGTLRDDDRRDVLAHDFERLRRDADAKHAARFVGPDVGVERRAPAASA